MCNGGYGNNSCFWIILILILLFACGGCGGGCGNNGGICAGNGGGCGCGC